MVPTTSTFPKILARLLTAKEHSQFLELILTAKEREEIEQRIAILQRISEGESQREIAQSLGVGIATVTRGAKAWRDLREDEQHLYYQLLHRKT